MVSDAWVAERIERFDEVLADPRDLLAPVTIISELGCGPEATGDPSVMLDDIAAEVAVHSADGIVEHVFGSGGFRGNAGDYYDPHNSFVHSVLRRRLGIPISLGIVAIEVARRCDVDLVGVGFPGHFLIGGEGELFDPFDNGRRLEAGDLEPLASRAGVQRPVPEWLLGPSPRDEIVHRVLRNLTTIFDATHSWSALDWCLALRVILTPDDTSIVRRRAGVLAQLGYTWRAADLLDSVVDDSHRGQRDRAAAERFRAHLN